MRRLGKIMFSSEGRWGPSRNKVPCASSNSCSAAFNFPEEEEKTALCNVITLAEVVILKVIIFI